MERSLVINAKGKNIEIALLEDKQLVEFNQEGEAAQFTVGDLYLARVKKLVPGLNAAFVYVGYDRDAFLHYTDLSPNIRSILKFTHHSLSGKQRTHMLKDFKFEKQTVKSGKITDVLKQNQLILVQVAKEPISTKGPRLSCEITLPGRYLVLYPFNDMIGVSKKIRKRGERKRLEKLIQSIKPKNFGVIVRTAATGKKTAELVNDLSHLIDKWEIGFRELKAAGNKDLGKVQAPKKVMSEVGRAKKILRDLLNTSFNNITVNEKDLYEEIKSYIHEIAPEQEKIVNFYKGKKPLFDKFNITKQIKSAFGKYVSMPKGAYLVIEKTEAFHVIDVNSGNRVDHKRSLEKNALSINKAAAREVARQLRLRDMGGMILIDFIDMKNPKNKKELEKYMKKLMKMDRTRHTILPLSKLNVMQIARQRVRPAVNIETAEQCPTCRGTGKVQPPLLLIDEIEHRLQAVTQQNSVPFVVNIKAHPFISAFLSEGLLSLQRKWSLKYGKFVKVHPDNNLHLTEYKFLDGKGNDLLKAPVEEEKQEEVTSRT